MQAPERLASPVDGKPAERVKPLQLPMTMGLEPYVFHGQFTPDRVGLWTYRVDGWGDPIHTWRHGLLAKLDAGQGEKELSNDLLVGAGLLERAATGVPRADREPLLTAAAALRAPGDPVTRTALALAPEIEEVLDTYPLREIVTRGEQHGVWVDRPLARFGSWYEMFPRSTGGWDADGNPCTAPSRRPPPTCRASPRWDSMSCICRRSIRSARYTARGETTPHRGSRRCGLALGNW